MNTYIYRNNKSGGDIVHTVVCNDIFAADNSLKHATGINAASSPWIGCEILFNADLT